MNNVQLIGRIACPIEVKESNGVKRLHFSLAVHREGTEDKTDFIPCTAWRQSAEFIGKYFKKGDFIGITGSIKVNNYETEEGEKRTSVDVSVRRAEFTQNKQAGADEEGKNRPTLQPYDDDEDMPF